LIGINLGASVLLPRLGRDSHVLPRSFGPETPTRLGAVSFAWARCIRNRSCRPGVGNCAGVKAASPTSACEELGLDIQAGFFASGSGPFLCLERSLIIRLSVPCPKPFGLRLSGLPCLRWPSSGSACSCSRCRRARPITSQRIRVLINKLTSGNTTRVAKKKTSPTSKNKSAEAIAHTPTLQS
jgi:hypothetical protein